MAVTTTVLAYFIDLLPHAVDNDVTLVESNNTAAISGNEATQVD